MKRPFLLSLLLLTTLAFAAPRVGTHDGFTRLVFDLPRAANVTTTVTASNVTVKLNVPLKVEQGSLRTSDVTAYAVRAATGGSTVSLTVLPGRRATAFVLPAGGGLPPRLVVDVGTKVSGTAPSNTPVVRPAALVKPAAPKLRVVLDPGHGGVDPGMVGYVVEKEVVLDVSLRVRERLKSRGIEVVMTRGRDTQLSVTKATDLNMRANMANAGTVNAFVSIHVNAAAPSAQGIETWVFGQLLDPRSRAVAVRENGGGELGERITRESSNAAQNLVGDLLAQSKLAYSKKLAELVQRNLISTTGAVNRGVGSAPFAVIRESRTPAILIELGFGSHAVEGRKLAQEAYRDRLAIAIADAVAAFLHAK